MPGPGKKNMASCHIVDLPPHSSSMPAHILGGINLEPRQGLCGYGMISHYMVHLTGNICTIALLVRGRK